VTNPMRLMGTGLSAAFFTQQKGLPMFDLIRSFIAVRRMAKLSRLVELAKQADEVLLGCNLKPDTRQLLQQRRDELEEQIRELQAA